MTRIAALILSDPRNDTVFAGMGLTERAVRTAARAGAAHIHIAGARPADITLAGTLRQRGISVTWNLSEKQPFASAPRAGKLLVVRAGTIAEPRAVKALSALDVNDGDAVLMVDQSEMTYRRVQVAGGRVTSVFADGNASSLGIALMSDSAVEQVRHARTLHEALHRLTRLGRLRARSNSGCFVKKLSGDAEVAQVEAEYLRQTSGGDREGFFTKQIRRFSIPLSRALLMTSATANQITIAGFMLSVLAGICFFQWGYWSGLAGAVAYYVSMICDCSDGEVARARLSDSKFGAWLETVTDYLSYFVVFGAIVSGDVRHEGFCQHAISAIIASFASLAIMSIVGYLRARVAGANPGAFDDALADELKQGTPAQKFAAWGRQLIKRSFLAHLIVFQAVIGFVPALVELWAYGSVAALIVILIVHSHIVNAVRVEPLQPAATL
jgi:phosphatidylglycerophosphate synthase